MTRDERFQAPARPDGPDLAVVAHDDQLRPGRLGGGEQPEHGGVVGHARLIADDHALAVQLELAMVEPPQQGRDGTGLVDARLRPQSASGLARYRRPQHPEPGALERPAGGVEGGALAGAGHPHDQLHPAPRGGHRVHHRPLAGGERPAIQLPFLGFNGRTDRLGGYGRRVPALGLEGRFEGDGGLVGDGTSGGVGLFPGRLHTDQRDGVGVGAHRLDDT